MCLVVQEVCVDRELFVFLHRVRVVLSPVLATMNTPLVNVKILVALGEVHILGVVNNVD
jgi:hypothetical protein